MSGIAAARPALVDAHTIDGRHGAGEVRGQDRTGIRARSDNVPVVQPGTDGSHTLRPERSGLGAGGTSRVVAAHVMQTDIPFSNGVVYVVGHVLVHLRWPYPGAVRTKEGPMHLGRPVPLSAAMDATGPRYRDTDVPAREQAAPVGFAAAALHSRGERWRPTVHRRPMR